jgi:hypothetical protein
MPQYIGTHHVVGTEVCRGFSFYPTRHSMPGRIQPLEGPVRYSSRKAALATSRNRLPWRHHVKRQALKQSPAEKKALAEQRNSRKLTYQNALSKASESIYNEAIKLREQFGTHSLEYYMEELMQQSRLSRNKRAINSWNVYLRGEVKCINDGE